MKKSPFDGLVIRTAVARRPDLGFIYACDPKKEEKNIGHAITFKWKAGVFTQGECDYDAHSACYIEQPEIALVDISEPGYYSVETQSGVTTADIFDKSSPPPKKRRLGGFRSVTEIDGKAFAVGFRGMVYRLESPSKWARIDEGLPDTFEIEAIHGFDASDLYAVGDDGEVWHSDGKKWARYELPTNFNLNAVKCAGNGKVYVAGDDGILLHGKGHTWDVINHGRTDDIWDLEWFDGKLYVSTMDNVYRLKKDQLELVDFGDDEPKSCYQLTAGKGVMWSNGEFDIMSFDGRKWTRIV